MTDRVGSAAAALLEAEERARPITPLTDDWPDLDVALAYAAQDRALDLRRERGERVVGIKLGLTSRAKQERMGVDQPIVAWLTDRMVLPTGTPVPFPSLIQPRAEPEIAFVMAHRLVGPGVTAALAMAAVGAVYGSVELIDSRFVDYRFTLPDVIADNASSCLFAMGPRGRSPASLDLTQEGCVLLVAGEVLSSATGAAVLGHPAEALALAANLLAERDLAIEAGWLVLTGGMTDAVPILPGRSVTARFTSLGDLSLA
jgi:2-oxo-3-hexenedioate decarboxylase